MKTILDLLFDIDIDALNPRNFKFYLEPEVSEMVCASLKYLIMKNGLDIKRIKNHLAIYRNSTASPELRHLILARAVIKSNATCCNLSQFECLQVRKSLMLINRLVKGDES